MYASARFTDYTADINTHKKNASLAEKKRSHRMENVHRRSDWNKFYKLTGANCFLPRAHTYIQYRSTKNWLFLFVKFIFSVTRLFIFFYSLCGLVAAGRKNTGNNFAGIIIANTQLYPRGFTLTQTQDIFNKRWKKTKHNFLLYCLHAFIFIFLPK